VAEMNACFKQLFHSDNCHIIPPLNLLASTVFKGDYCGIEKIFPPRVACLASANFYSQVILSKNKPFVKQKRGKKQTFSHA
jgi:hypothetical protein